ncbi:MAG: hypothetical protein H6765_00915 [Candidatus Peribacteria bacterium]|nr:MAG: hypothetical protein H6765_00915 [Candidatus Peribacteria bacterium]
MIEARAFAVANYLDNKVAFMAHVDQQLAWVARRKKLLSRNKTRQV